jgi:hypothetical protein
VAIIGAIHQNPFDVTRVSGHGFEPCNRLLGFPSLPQALPYIPEFRIDRNELAIHGLD